MIECCPACEGSLSELNLPKSKAAPDFTDGGGKHFSLLHKCNSCQWWAVWEEWIDYMYGKAGYLIIGLADETPTILDEPWKQILEDEHIYDSVEPLPESLRDIFSGGEKRVWDIPKPGTKVSLIGEVHIMSRDNLIGDIFTRLRGRAHESIPLYISGSVGTVISDGELYIVIKKEKKSWRKDWYKATELEKEAQQQQLAILKRSLWIVNFCPVRLEKLIFTPGKGNSSLYKEGEVYFIDAADIKEIY